MIGAPRTCSVEGCQSRCAPSRTLCSKHRYRLWKYGNLSAPLPSYRKTAAWRPGARTHGMSKTPIYKTWRNIIERCTNPKHVGWKDYGGRGITVCPRWRDSFTAFLEDMGDRPSLVSTIDRIDPNRGYEPGNCRWLESRSEQQNNRRCTVRLTIEQVTHPLAEWARLSGAPPQRIWERVQRGWSAYDAVFSPPNRGQRRAPK